MAQILGWNDVENVDTRLEIADRAKRSAETERIRRIRYADRTIGRILEEEALGLTLDNGKEKLHGQFGPKPGVGSSTLQEYIELSEISGVAQDITGDYTPRGGWEFDTLTAKQIPSTFHNPRGCGDVRPEATNPLRAYIQAARNTPAYNRIQSWLERNQQIERGA